MATMLLTCVCTRVCACMRACIFFYNLNFLTFTLFPELRSSDKTWGNLLRHLEAVGCNCALQERRNESGI